MPIRRLIWMRRARKHFSAARYSQAAIWCEMTLEIDRKCAEAKELKRITKEAAVRWAVKAALAEDESSPDEEMDIAFWLIEAKRPYEAGILIRRAVRRHQRESPDKPLPEWIRIARAETDYLAGDVKRADGEFEELRDSGQFGPEATYYSALCKLANGERHRALACFEKFISKFPWFLEARFEEALEEADSRSG